MNKKVIKKEEPKPYNYCPYSDKECIWSHISKGTFTCIAPDDENDKEDWPETK